jgi:hypothetical protein
LVRVRVCTCVWGHGCAHEHKGDPVTSTQPLGAPTPTSNWDASLPMSIRWLQKAGLARNRLLDSWCRWRQYMLYRTFDFHVRRHLPTR